MYDLVVCAVAICRLLLLLASSEGVASGNSKVSTGCCVGSVGFAGLIHSDFIQT